MNNQKFKVGQRVVDKQLGAGTVVGFECFNDGHSVAPVLVDSGDSRVIVKLDNPQAWLFHESGHPHCMRHDLTPEGV